MGSLCLPFHHAELDEVLTFAQADPCDNSPAMNEVLRRFTPLANRIARRHTTCPHLQEDIVNECLRVTIGAIRRHKIGQPGFPSYVKSFMRGAASRQVQQERDRLTDHGTIRLVSINEAGFVEPANNGLSIDEEVIHQIDDRWGSGPVAEAMLQLTLAQQQVLWQIFGEGFRVTEVAASAGVSSSAISQRLAGAHRALDQAMAA